MIKTWVLSILIAVASLSCADHKPPVSNTVTESQSADESTQDHSEVKRDITIEQWNPEIDPPLTETEKNKVSTGKSSRGWILLKDAAAEKLILVTMGTKRTGGYSLHLKESSVQDDEIRLVVEEITPGKDAMVTMAITYPRLILVCRSNTKMGKIKITVVNQNEEAFPQIEQ